MNGPTFADNLRSRPLLIRSNHPNAFRSGQWAKIVSTEHYIPLDDGINRAVFVVEWIDGHQDRWPIDDPSAKYEFDRMVTV